MEIVELIEEYFTSHNNMAHFKNILTAWDDALKLN